MDLERDFAAWADRRDAAALTRVFDATAGRLSLLAAHVTGEDADDLVQSTFVAAMTQAATWDSRRPLWPWLAGILQNQIRMHWRREERRREVGLDDATEAPADGPDPAACVASDEAFDALVVAIDALPLPYRQVLRLRLVHGLEPIEIARALERPVGTVRAQLHRGTAQLRDALPAGLAIAAWLGSAGAVLAQVRAHVIARANAMAVEAAPTGALVATAGWWTMNAKTMFGLAAAVGLLFLLISRLGEPATPDGGAPEPQPATPAHDAVAAIADLPADSPTVPERVAVDEDVAIAWPLDVRVAGPDGPLAGVPVQVRIVPRGDGYQDPFEPEGGEFVASGATNEAGVFRCALDAYRERSALFRCTNFVAVRVAPDGREARGELLALPRTNEPRSFSCSIELAAAARVRGRVVDEAGAPVAGARIHEAWVTRPDLLHETRAVTLADGTFALSIDPDEPDVWPARVVASAPGAGIGSVAVRPPERPLSRATSIDVGTVVLVRGSEIRGRAVLADGSPLAGYPLFVVTIPPDTATDEDALQHAFAERRELAWSDGRAVQTGATLKTAADGSFVWAGLAPDTVCAVAVRDACVRLTTAVARVGEPVRLVVERQLLRLDVRALDGEALPGLTVRGACYDPARDAPSWEERPGFPARGQVGSGAFFPVDLDGRRLVLSPFTWTWCLYVTDEIAQVTPLRHDVMPGVHRIERSLIVDAAAGFGALRIVVVDADGEPVSDYGFRMRHVTRDLDRNHARLIPPEDGTYRDLAAGRWHVTMLYGHPLHEVFGLETPGRGAEEFDVVIEDGATTGVRVVSAPAGRVAFRLRADRPPDSGHWGAVRIVAEADGATVPTTMECDDPTKPGWALDELFFLCGPAFPPGRHAFAVSVDGYLPARCEVDVVDDRLTQRTLELVRR